MSDFKTVLVRDSVIGDITSDIDFAVKSGASQTTFQRFPSTSASNSSLIYSVQVPSENVVIGRDVLINSGISFTMTLGNTGGVGTPGAVPVGATCFDYGVSDSLAAFPLASLMTTATAQINNTTVSTNLQDILPSILRLNNSRELYRYNSGTPSLPDQAYARYADALGANNNPLAGYTNASYDIDQVPRGAHPASITIARTDGAGGAGDASPVAVNANDTWVIEFSTVVAEPLFLSPFIFGDPEYNQQGLLGINNMTFTFNIDATCKRLFSTANPYIRTIALGTAANPNGFTAGGAVLTQQIPTTPSLLFKFLSTQPSDLVETKNVVPYMDMPRYLTSSANTTSVAAQGSATLTSSNLQINQIPDLLIINVRKPMNSQTVQDASAFFTINNISINLNNQSGLLSSASQYDLWRMSVKNGSTQSFSEFGGVVQRAAGAGGVGVALNSTGSLLILSPAYDLSLPDYITCGSLGNYNLQFQIGCSNTLSATGGAAITPEICVIAANSGILTTQQGVSAIYTGILTKEMVLNAKSRQQASAMKSAEIKRMVGGNMLNMPLHGIVRAACRRFGGVSSGGVPSGGATSGGAKGLC
tara:strand:- start:7571 stop:9337 length:1767 start_codon:yes stop_codon:yes gene_type:complete